MYVTQLEIPSLRPEPRRGASTARDGRPLLVAAVVGSVALVAFAVVTAPLDRTDRPSSGTTPRPAATWTSSAHHTNP
jgi:hypothetical protein